jgi:hypothetical protein
MPTYKLHLLSTVSAARTSELAVSTIVQGLRDNNKNSQAYYTELLGAESIIYAIVGNDTDKQLFNRWIDNKKKIFNNNSK